MVPIKQSRIQLWKKPYLLGGRYSASQYKTVLFVGRIEADKGIRVFVDAVLGVLSSDVNGFARNCCGVGLAS